MFTVQDKCLYQRQADFYFRYAPNYSVTIFPKANLGDLPKEIDKFIKEIIDKSI